MRTRCLRLGSAALCLLAWAMPARAQAPAQDPIARLIGLPIVSVELRIEGKPDTTPALLAFIDIRPGDRLTPEAWRRVTQRFDQIQRFEGVSVKVDERPDGVALIFDLVPRYPIEAMTFSGIAGVLVPDLERQVKEVFNGLPQADRLTDVEEEVERILHNEGYRSATATATVLRTHDPERATLEVAVVAGPRALIKSWDLRGNVPMDLTARLARIGVAQGEPLRMRALATGLSEIRDELRAKQFYTAVAQMLPPTVSADGTEASLVIAINAGPLVELRVVGELPGSVDEFIPLKRENSVDTDLLEDSQRRIVQKFRDDGYKNAQASFCGVPDYPCSAAVAPPPSPDRMVITFTVDRGKRYRIMGVDMPSTLTMTAAELQVHKELKPGAWFDQKAVESALLFVKGRYQDLGFHLVVLKPTYDEVPGRHADEGGVIIHPNITEGPKATVTSITFDLGDHPRVTAAELAEFMLTKERRPYVLGNLVLDQQGLPALYESRGFLNRVVGITPTANADGTEVKLAVVAREGPQVTVGEIIVVGNEKVSSETILREVTLKVGQPYSEVARAESRRQLFKNLSAFKNVQITADERLPGETTVRVVISVEETSPTTFDVGGGLEGGSRPVTNDQGISEDRIYLAPRAFVGVGRRNLGGRNRSINAFGRVSFKRPTSAANPTVRLDFTEYRVTTSYDERYAFHSSTDILISLTSEQGIRTNFNFTRRDATVRMLRPITSRLSVVGQYSLDWTRRFDEAIPADEQLLIDKLFPQVRLSIFSGGFLWDNKNNELAPTSGGQINGNVDVALRPLGSEVGFVKSFAQAAIYRRIPAPRPVTFAGRVQLGAARGFDITDLPISQRFFAGGSTSVRGFQLDRLGVEEIMTANGLSNGGNGLIVFNAEVRAIVGKLYKRDLTLVAFLDTGNVFNRASDIDLRRLRAAAGFGVRYDSPLGPLRLDFGFKTDRMIFPQAIERRWEFHLSIGEVF